MSDYIVRATAADSQIRAFAITSKEMVEEARRAHDTRPVITAALGRLLSGAAMMGTMMKGDNDLLTIQIQCGGPAKGLTVTADSHGHVKGFPMESQVELPLNAQGKLDVGGALGLGVMSVIKDMGLKEPYVGQIALQTGDRGAAQPQYPFLDADAGEYLRRFHYLLVHHFFRYDRQYDL